MRTSASDAALASAASWSCRVSSWLGTTLLAGDVPVLRGRVNAVTSRFVPEEIEFAVAPFSIEAGRTKSWLPRDPAAPLGRFGQTVDVTVTVAGVDTRIGRFLITSWEEQADGSIVVRGAGLLQQAEDDRLVVATGPRDGGTLRSEFLRMLPGYMTAGFASSLVDRVVPRTMEWDENRLENLYQIADSWPARLRTDSWGQVQVLPPLPLSSTPMMTIRDGGRVVKRVSITTGDTYPGDDIYEETYPGSIKIAEVPQTPGGTLISAPTSDTRKGAYNTFVARSSADGVEAQAVATVQGGPMDPSGPYRPVPKFFPSPLLDTVEECLAAATAMRDEAVRQSRIRRVTFAPDPRLELDDPVEIITGWSTPKQFREWGYVVGYDLPLTIKDGPSRVDVATF